MKSRCCEKTVLSCATSTQREQKMFKVMKERIRRARIGKSLEELKLLILGESSKIFRLDQADILEFTVKHLRRLRRTAKDGREHAQLSNDSLQGQKEKMNAEQAINGFQFENQENDDIVSIMKDSALCSKKMSKKEVSGLSVSATEKHKKNKLTALRISIPPTRESVIRPVSNAAQQSNLLVPLQRQENMAVTLPRSVDFISRPSDRAQRKPLAETNCKSQNFNVVMDSTLWRPWS